MNKNDVVAKVAEETGLQKGVAVRAVDAVFSAIEDGLKSREEVRLIGFGSFTTTTRKASTGRHPRTGEEMPIAASTSVRFRPGKGLKDAVN